MPGRGIQYLPLGRIPKVWDAAWYADHLRDVLALADARNSIGDGLEITGQPDQVATFAVNADIQALLEQPFVLAQPSGFLENERTLAGEDGVIQILDGGPDANITVSLVDGGVTLEKLGAISRTTVLGNALGSGGPVDQIRADVDKAVLHRDGTTLEFDLIDSTFISDFEEAVQDVMGSTLTDSTGVDWVYDDLTGTILANLNFANPSATIGLTAVNGTAATPMRSDAAPALSQAIAPTWSAQHIFAAAGAHLSSAVLLSSANPAIAWYTPGGAADEKLWDLNSLGGSVLALRAKNDAATISRNAFTMFRSGVALTDLEFGNFIDLPNVAFYGNMRLLSDARELQLGVSQDLRLYHDGTDSFIRNDTGVLNVNQGATTVARFDSDSTAGNTRLMVYDVDNGTLERVSVGAADSGGTGFKVLRIPN